jgi:hypothetical protein
MNKLIKTVSSEKLNYEFLHSLNGIIGLTERELHLLSLFLDLPPSRSKSDKESIDSSGNRKLVMSRTGITKDNLSRYIKLYKQKGLFIKDRNSECYIINPAIIPILIGGKTVQITMILKINEDGIQQK